MVATLPCNCWFTLFTISAVRVFCHRAGSSDGGDVDEDVGTSDHRETDMTMMSATAVNTQYPLWVGVCYKVFEKAYSVITYYQRNQLFSCYRQESRLL